MPIRQPKKTSDEPVALPPIHYEREHSGELIQMDIKNLGTLRAPRRAGHQQPCRSQRRHRRDASLHVAIDDPSRLGFVCAHPNEKIPSTVAALEKVFSLYTFLRYQRGSEGLTDNGSCYTLMPLTFLVRGGVSNTASIDTLSASD